MGIIIMIYKYHCMINVPHVALYTYINSLYDILREREKKKKSWEVENYSEVGKVVVILFWRGKIAKYEYRLVQQRPTPQGVLINEFWFRQKLETTLIYEWTESQPKKCTWNNSEYYFNRIAGFINVKDRKLKRQIIFKVTVYNKMTNDHEQIYISALNKRRNFCN